MTLVWGTCYSYNKQVAKKFLENESLALLFLIASNFIRANEIKNSQSSLKEQTLEELEEYKMKALWTLEEKELYLKFYDSLVGDSNC